MSRLEFYNGKENSRNRKKYEIKAICNSATYTKASEKSQLLGFYYLVSWKNYPEEENSWESVSAIQHLWKLITTFYKEHSKKPTTTSPPINTALLLAKSIAKPPTKTLIKQKRGEPAKTPGVSKSTRNCWAFYLVLNPVLRANKKLYSQSQPSNFPGSNFRFLSTISRKSLEVFSQSIFDFSSLFSAKIWWFFCNQLLGFLHHSLLRVGDFSPILDTTYSYPL